MAEPYLPVYINGKLMAAEDATVSVFDRGFTRGDGLFETVRAYGGQIFKLNEHLARLDRGLAALHYPVRSSDLDLKAAIEETLRASGLRNARIRAQVTRGAGSTEFTLRTDTPPTVVVSVQSITNAVAKPIDVIIASIRRDEHSPLTRIKTTNYIPSLLARMEAEQAGAGDAIMLNYAGFVAEACTSNIFMARSGVLVTPDIASGVLPGIIRDTMLEIASDLGIPVEERHFKPDVLETADEIFLTSSVREVAPVATLNGTRVGTGSHEMAERLYAEYQARTEGW